MQSVSCRAILQSDGIEGRASSLSGNLWARIPLKVEF